MNCAFHLKMLFIKVFWFAYDVIICVYLTFEKVPCSQYRCKPTEDLVCMFNIQPTAVLNKSLHEGTAQKLLQLTININRRQHYLIICIVVFWLHPFIEYLSNSQFIWRINSYFIGCALIKRQLIFIFGILLDPSPIIAWLCLQLINCCFWRHLIDLTMTEALD